MKAAKQVSSLDIALKKNPQRWHHATRRGIRAAQRGERAPWAPWLAVAGWVKVLDRLDATTRDMVSGKSMRRRLRGK